MQKSTTPFIQQVVGKNQRNELRVFHATSSLRFLECTPHSFMSKCGILSGMTNVANCPDITKMQKLLILAWEKCRVCMQNDMLH